MKRLTEYEFSVAETKKVRLAEYTSIDAVSEAWDAYNEIWDAYNKLLFENHQLKAILAMSKISVTPLQPGSGVKIIAEGDEGLGEDKCY